MDEPTKLTEIEAKGGSKTKANYAVLIISLVIIVLAFGTVYAIYG